MPREKLDVLDDSTMTFLPVVSDDYTIEIAQEEIYDSVRSGELNHDCPCCGQRTRVYKTRPDPRSLVALVEVAIEFRHTRDWVDITDKVKGSAGNFLMWRHWGFIEVSDELQRDGKHKWAKSSRLVKPTEAAYEWLNGETEVSTHIFLFNRKPIGPTARTMSFKELAGRKFYNMKKKLDDLPGMIRPKKVKLKKKMKLKRKQDQADT